MGPSFDASMLSPSSSGLKPADGSCAHDSDATESEFDSLLNQQLASQPAEDEITGSNPALTGDADDSSIESSAEHDSSTDTPPQADLEADNVPATQVTVTAITDAPTPSLSADSGKAETVVDNSNHLREGQASKRYADVSIVDTSTGSTKSESGVDAKSSEQGAQTNLSANRAVDSTVIQPNQIGSGSHSQPSVSADGQSLPLKAGEFPPQQVALVNSTEKGELSAQHAITAKPAEKRDVDSKEVLLQNKSTKDQLNQATSVAVQSQSSKDRPTYLLSESQGASAGKSDGAIKTDAQPTAKSDLVTVLAQSKAMLKGIQEGLQTRAKGHSVRLEGLVNQPASTAATTQDVHPLVNSERPLLSQNHLNTASVAQTLPQAQTQAQTPMQMTPGQIQNQIQAMIRHGQQHAEIRLDPAELGSLQIRIQMQGEQAQVQFMAAQPHARELLESALPRLRELMQQQGLDLGNTDVSGQESKEQQAHSDSRDDDAHSLWVQNPLEDGSEVQDLPFDPHKSSSAEGWSIGYARRIDYYA
ncbi:flagellar hook-length control protein FliK [Paraferrimonas sedimenticola]|uniref:Flagellar hook-length control protein FliK n=1 Tax=Paraferrimonas sedimenticola TaxID=375674 RepID=A0AA37RTG4_9GAMM|nr:flagellar hook-length control protein FliK [Paraferrimonas sedimenticola]GLP94969.1 flagellar hook-length control protein FliK [Paraferrimonas sedimenticola]